MKLSFSFIAPQLGQLGLLAIMSSNPLASAQLIQSALADDKDKLLLVNKAEKDGDLNDGQVVLPPTKPRLVLKDNGVSAAADTGVLLRGSGSNTIDATPEDNLAYASSFVPSKLNDGKRSEKIINLIVGMSDFDQDLQVIVDFAISILEEQQIEFAYDIIDKVTNHVKKASLKWHGLDDEDKVNMLRKILKLIVVQHSTTTLKGEDSKPSDDSDSVDTGVLGTSRILGKAKSGDDLFDPPAPTPGSRIIKIISTRIDNIVDLTTDDSDTVLEKVSQALSSVGIVVDLKEVDDSDLKSAVKKFVRAYKKAKSEESKASSLNRFKDDTLPLFGGSTSYGVSQGCADPLFANPPYSVGYNDCCSSNADCVGYTDGKKGSTYCSSFAKCSCNIGRFYSPTYPFAPLVLQTLGQCCEFATDCEAELYCCPSVYEANEAGIFKAINPNTCVESSQDCVGITNSPSTSVSPTTSPTDSCSFGDNGSISRYGECNNDLCCQGYYDGGGVTCQDSQCTCNLVGINELGECCSSDSNCKSGFCAQVGPDNDNKFCATLSCGTGSYSKAPTPSPSSCGVAENFVVQRGGECDRNSCCFGYTTDTVFGSVNCNDGTCQCLTSPYFGNPISFCCDGDNDCADFGTTCVSGFCKVAQ